MIAGTVLFIKDFKFADGGTSNKLLIILNTPQKGEPYLVCPTTSQKNHRKPDLGCHSEDNYFYIDEKQDSFKLNTWVIFHRIYSFLTEDILNKKFKGSAVIEFQLNNTLWKCLKNCILKSKDIEQDYLEMISRT
ncbi:MAG TPA: hypothetical protein PKW76_16925 [bacterium]|nr:hypothetical protein [bacterium]HPG47354.1 hypothetical protein [bacterium]HPM96706.1 hypothetical protein [bacterium]